MAPLRIAHRGMPRLEKENTLASFARALECGAEGIELDVHATKDDVIVVHHDPEHSGGIPIRELSAADLVREMRDIPTLASVCALVRGRAELFVEIKGAGIEEVVQRTLAGYPGVAAIHSFDHELIRRLSRHGSERRLGVLVEDASSDPMEVMARCGADDLWPHHSMVTAILVDAVHHADGRVIPWTVNELPDIQRLTAIAVDGICTDDVRLLQESQ
jgi:Glycerophosphoryl diester phosphodiesterase